MPQVERWERLPLAVRQHLVDRMAERGIGTNDLNQLRQWLESKPSVPEGDWHKDFGNFKLCGSGPLLKTSLLWGQAAYGEAL